MPQEIERKFLVFSLPEWLDLKDTPHQQIRQGYLSIGVDGSEVRLRQAGDIYLQTVKSGSGLVRGEWEVQIPKGVFQAFWPATKDRRISKLRYQVTLSDQATPRLAQLDIYAGELSGLMVAETEFSSLESSSQFTVPKWFGTEVTADPDYKNQSLALKGLPGSFQRR